MALHGAVCPDTQVRLIWQYLITLTLQPCYTGNVLTNVSWRFVGGGRDIEQFKAEISTVYSGAADELKD